MVPYFRISYPTVFLSFPLRNFALRLLCMLLDLLRFQLRWNYCFARSSGPSSSSLAPPFYSKFKVLFGRCRVLADIFLLVAYSPYPLIVYLIATAVLAATKQPIVIAAFFTWVYPLSQANWGDDRESGWLTQTHAVIVGSTLFYVGWCFLPFTRKNFVS
jgi:hypothetical protein